MSFLRFVSIICLVVLSSSGASEAQDQKVIPQTRDDLQYSFAPLIKRVAPAVVNIFAVRKSQTHSPSPLEQDPVFKHFFGESGPQARLQRSLGSGVIVRPDGIVITNYHVIRNADAIKVVLSDGREFEAKLLVHDNRTDLAALRLNAQGASLPFLELKDSDELEVGDIVLAIGNPFGFGQTVTSGIVSGLARSQLGVHDIRSLIQTDAAVNPGNSGGPLVTMDGKVVGINTAIYSNTGASIGISFAVPSNLVVPVLTSIETGGKVVRPWIGIMMKSITAKMASDYKLPAPTGVLLTRVFDDSTAKKAGLEVGDILLKIDGVEIKNESSYRFRIATSKVGEEKVFTILRRGEERDIRVKLQAPPDLSQEKKIEISGRNPLSGSVVMSLTPYIAAEYALPYQDEGGVVVISVRKGTLAAQSGLIPGDVIVSVNDEPVASLEDLIKKLRRSGGRWQLAIKRGSRKFVQDW